MASVAWGRPLCNCGATCAAREAVLAWSRGGWTHAETLLGMADPVGSGRGLLEGSRSPRCSEAPSPCEAQMVPFLGHLRGQVLGPSGGSCCQALCPKTFRRPSHPAGFGAHRTLPPLAVPVTTSWPRCFPISPQPLNLQGGPAPRAQRGCVRARPWGPRGPGPAWRLCSRCPHPEPPLLCLSLCRSVSSGGGASLCDPSPRAEATSTASVPASSKTLVL